MGRLFKRSLNAFSLVSEIEMVYTMLGMAHNWWAIRWQFLSVKALSSRFSVALAGKTEVRSCMVSDAFKCFWPNHFSLLQERAHSIHTSWADANRVAVYCVNWVYAAGWILSNGWPTSVYQCVPGCTWVYAKRSLAITLIRHSNRVPT